MLRCNCVKGVHVKILDKTYGEPLRNIGSTRVGIIESNDRFYVNVIPKYFNFNRPSYCFNHSDIELLGGVEDGQ
jgi:hypothetical protein